MSTSTQNGTAARISWIDIARGICILMVVAMHSTLGVERASEATGWMGHVVRWTMPFRIPDFFFISGFLAAGVAAMPRARFIDAKIVFFGYFYLLWLAINLALRIAVAPRGETDAFFPELVTGLVDPFGMLWFIYILPLFYIVLRITGDGQRRLILATAAVLHIVAAAARDEAEAVMASTLTGWMAFDSFSLFLIFFLLGAAGRNHVLGLVGHIQNHPRLAVVGLAVWGVLHTLALQAGFATMAGPSIVFGLAGALAIATAAVLLAQLGWLGWLAFVGRNSLAIYLAFSIPMALSRTFLIRYDIVKDVGWQALVVTVIAVIMPLAMQAAVASGPLRFLFIRPNWARLGGQRLAASTQPVAG